MKDTDSKMIYEILGKEYSNIYVMDCRNQHIFPYLENTKFTGFSQYLHYDEAMNAYIEKEVYVNDQAMLKMSVCFDSLLERLKFVDQFSIHYRTKQEGELHFMFVHVSKIVENGSLSKIVVAFANEDLDIRRNNLEMMNNEITNSLRRKVLIVEDNELNREILKSALLDDYDVLEAVNGEDGLRVLSENYKDISIILLDVVMPICDGFEFLRRQKMDSLISNIPVIVTTGSNSQEDELKCLGLGAVDFITKPYNSRIVKGRINSVIKLRESSMTLAAVEKDELTSLYTKQAFYHHAKTLMNYVSNEKFNVIVMDVADFKLINGTYGTKMGDEVLIYLANAFRYYLKDALLTRYEGDQILGIYHSNQKIDVARISSNIDKLVENAPIPNIRIKVGIYENVDVHLPISIICDRALMACKSIQKDYSKNIAFFTEEMNRKQLAQREMENEFNEAIDKKEFKVYFQPKYNVETEEIVGAEALVRWQKDNGQVISPGEFISLFEKDGLIVRLDEYVFETVCQFQKNRVKANQKIIPISINLSRASIHYNNVVQRYVDIVKENEIPFNSIPIELTESAALNSPKIARITDQLVKSGFTLHMDDFGSGYSSLTTLNELKFTTLKIDKSLIDYINSDRGNKIVQQAINLAHGLDMKVVAEGVEDKNQKECLKNMGCDEIQGFYYSKPLKCEDFLKQI